MNPLGAVYGRAVGWRRSWYTRHPDRRARLAPPVVSIGNLAVGGSGKTPLALHAAQLLVGAGLRPAILSRGYGRRVMTTEPVVVSDGSRILAEVQASGDEPQMLARQLPGVPVVVCARRAEAGRLAVARFAPDVLLLDDGYQHLELWRDVDLLIVSPEDLDSDLLPLGPLREPLGAARAAHALVVPGTDGDAAHVAQALGVRPVFTMTRHLGRPQVLSAGDAGASRRAGPADPPAGPVLVVAGIARPQRFVSAVRELGLSVAGEMLFRDHYWFTARDIARIEAVARERGAAWVATTEKDAVRLERLPRTLSWARVPLRVEVSPPVFGPWLLERVDRARGDDPGARSVGRP